LPRGRFAKGLPRACGRVEGPKVVEVFQLLTRVIIATKEQYLPIAHGHAVTGASGGGTAAALNLLPLIGGWVEAPEVSEVVEFPLLGRSELAAKQVEGAVEADKLMATSTGRAAVPSDNSPLACVGSEPKELREDFHEAMFVHRFAPVEDQLILGLALPWQCGEGAGGTGWRWSTGVPQNFWLPFSGVPLLLGKDGIDVLIILPPLLLLLGFRRLRLCVRVGFSASAALLPFVPLAPHLLSLCVE